MCRLPGFSEKEAKGSHVRIKSEVLGESGAPRSPRRPVLSTASSSADPGALWGSNVDGRGSWPGKACPEPGCCGKGRLSWASTV